MFTERRPEIPGEHRFVIPSTRKDEREIIVEIPQGNRRVFSDMNVVVREMDYSELPITK